METFFTYMHDLFTRSPEMAVFLSVALGYLVGQLKFGTFQLGGVAGSLLMAVLISQFNVTVSDTVKNILFALFIFAVGFDSGPQFFRSLGKKTIREVILALIVAVSGLLTVVIISKFAGFDKGLAAGIAAGGLTQSAIMGVASDALTKLGLAEDVTKTMAANVGVGYAVTYIFGTFGAIIVCANILPKFMGQSLRDAAIEAEAEMGQSLVLGNGETCALERLIGRIYQLDNNNFASVAAIEKAAGKTPVTVEMVKRGDASMPVSAELGLQKGDILLLVGQRNAVINLGEQIGTELIDVAGMDMVMKTQEVIITNPELVNVPFATLQKTVQGAMRHGVYILEASRAGTKLNLKDPSGTFRSEDILKIYGSQEDVKKAAAYAGTPIVPSDKTDFILVCLGLVLGLLLGMVTIRLGSIPLTLGSGGGVLLAGLFFGWLKNKHPKLGGTLPTSASQLLRDFGLAGFVAVVGLNSGLQAITTIKAQGVSIFVAGLVVTLLPLLIAMVAGKYLLGYKNAAFFAGALAGSRSANPAFGQVLNSAGNSVPTTPFAVTYALANVFLTLLGSLIVAFV